MDSLEDQYMDEWLEHNSYFRAEEEADLDDEDDVLDQFRDYWAGN